MSKSSLPLSSGSENHTAATRPSRPRPLILRLLAWCVVMGWRTCVDWRTKRPFLSRATAHLSIITLMLATIVVSGFGIPAPRAAVGSASDDADSPAPAGAATTITGTAASDTLPLTANWSPAPDADVVSRLPSAQTNIPDRPRAQVTVYIVKAGDTIYDIAAQFGLSPNTIVWSNREGINDAPWLIQPGLELYVPPVDGVYHTVRAGETVESIAAEHETEPSSLYNEWNDLEEGEQLREGQLLIVPGGVGEEVSWTPPPRYPRPGPAGYSYGICSGAAVTGPGGNGWFIYPTGSPRVSGWYFHDPRNPTHIGLDYACRTGDPLYAADNGVVTIAGWNGGYGILVELDHGNGFRTRYGHFSQLAVGCGHTVYQGDLLGYCGSTGWSSGSHLHFEIRHNGTPQDPQAYLP